MSKSIATLNNVKSYSSKTRLLLSFNFNKNHRFLFLPSSFNNAKSISRASISNGKKYLSTSTSSTTSLTTNTVTTSKTNLNIVTVAKSELPKSSPKGVNEDDLIPQIEKKPHFEYDNTRERRKISSFIEISKLSVERVMDPSNMIILALSACSVYLLGFYESSLLLRPELSYLDDNVLYFMNTFAARNCLSSIVWETIPADIIVQSMNLDPSIFLKDELLNTAADAQSYLHRVNLSISRSILGGFMIIGQLLRAVSVSMRASDDYYRKIRQGQQPIKGHGERIIRLAGHSSVATDVSMGTMGSHILPVFEKPNMVKDMIAYHSKNFTIPVFWKVNSGSYGSRRSWSKFHFEESNFLKTITGKKILWMEADCTDTSLFSPSKIDLSFEDACQTFRLIPMRAKFKGLRNFRVVRVVLGDLTTPYSSGGGHKYTIRDRLKDRKEADIVVDSNAYVYHTILAWCEKVTKNNPMPIIINTSNRNCFNTFSTLLKEHGYEVIDGADPNLHTEEINPDFNFKQAPRLIYYDSTMETVNAVYALHNAKAMDLNKCCAVFHEFSGLDALDALYIETNNQFQGVCSAVLFDKVFRQIRCWAREGHSTTEIQKAVDVRYNNKVLALANSKKGWCSVDDAKIKPLSANN